jgi:F-type H+-transporting ATPase subunit b
METPAYHILLVQMLTFVIGAVLLYFIALNPIRRILKERKDKIAGAQEGAAVERRNAENLTRELQDRLAKLEAGAKKRNALVEADAKKLKEELTAAARAAANEILKQGRIQLKEERAGMRSEIRRDVAKLSVAMATKVTATVLTAKDRKRLIGKVLKDLPSRLAGEA